VTSATLKRTPLHQAHVKAGARMVPFGGWDMPVQYTGIVEEHRTVRSAVGLFDVSHMGEFEVEGPGALAALQHLTTNDVAALHVGQVQYSLLCYPNGTIVDDLTVYRLAGDRFMLTVNASNIDKDYAWVTEHAKAARWRNVSAETGLIAVQGPRAETLVGRLADADVTKIGYYRFARGSVADVPALISRTGYTGEDGFELYAPADRTEKLWTELLAAGRADGSSGGAPPLGQRRSTKPTSMPPARNAGSRINQRCKGIEVRTPATRKPARPRSRRARASSRWPPTSIAVRRRRSPTRPASS